MMIHTFKVMLPIFKLDLTLKYNNKVYLEALQGFFFLNVLKLYFVILKNFRCLTLYSGLSHNMINCDLRYNFKKSL